MKKIIIGVLVVAVIVVVALMVGNKKSASDDQALVSETDTESLDQASEDIDTETPLETETDTSEFTMPKELSWDGHPDKKVFVFRAVSSKGDVAVYYPDILMKDGKQTKINPDVRQKIHDDISSDQIKDKIRLGVCDKDPAKNAIYAIPGGPPSFDPVTTTGCAKLLGRAEQMIYDAIK
jgi:hypothetical protein